MELRKFEYLFNDPVSLCASEHCPSACVRWRTDAGRASGFQWLRQNATAPRGEYATAT